MSSTHDESEDTASSLGDSSYDFIDDRSNVTTDDEEQDAMTASTTSSDGHEFDQPEVRSLGLGSNRHGDLVNNPVHGNASTSANNQEIPHHSNSSSLFGSRHEILSDHDVRLHPVDAQEAIEFDEPSVINLNSSRFIEVSHTLRMLKKHEPASMICDNLLDRLQSHMAVTARQTMTSHSLTPEGGSYKVMYLGDVESRDVIIQKLGTALAAGLESSTIEADQGRPSKFSVVPISAFGQEASPEVVLIDSSRLELIVEDCNYGSFARKDDGNDTLCLELACRLNVESSWTGSEFAITKGWKIPDLAIFVVPEDDTFATRRTRQAARSFMSRHSVPSIVVSQKTQWDKVPKDSITLDYLTPHVCLEARHSIDGHGQIIRRCPIDLTTFVNVNASQLNRNLACLAVAYRPTKPQAHAQPKSKVKKTYDEDKWSFKGTLESLIANLRNEGLLGLNRYEYIAAMLVTLLGMMVLGVGFTSILGASRISNSRIFPTDSSNSRNSQLPVSATLLPAAFEVSSTFDVVASSASSSSTNTSPMKSLSTNTDIASFLLHAYTLAPNKSEQFKVHVLGDCHIVLRPPHWFNKMKKSPKLLFEVLRGDSKIEHQITTLFEGVYALQIPREDAYGILRVVLSSESKPKISESFEVDFGSSWLKVVGWRQTAHALKENIPSNLGSFQTSLRKSYDDVKIQVLTWLQHQEGWIAAHGEAERAILHRHRTHIGNNKEMVIARTKDIARGFSTRLNSSKTVTLKQIQSSIKDLTLFTRESTAMVSRQARELSHAATGVDVKVLAQELREYRRRHLQETQKAVLKMLWKIGGAPKPRKKANMKAKFKSREAKAG